MNWQKKTLPNVLLHERMLTKAEKTSALGQEEVQQLGSRYQGREVALKA